MADLPIGVWRRGPLDWAYRIEVPGYGSIYGCGFSSGDDARAAKDRARAEAESKLAPSPTASEES